MLFSEVIGSLTQCGLQWHARVDEEWLQGRATFGGLVASLANEAMRRVARTDRPLRSLQTAFINPVGVGDIDIVPRLLRAGKGVIIAQCEVQQGGALCAMLTGVYGIDRESQAAFLPVVSSPAR